MVSNNLLWCGSAQAIWSLIRHRNTPNCHTMFTPEHSDLPETRVLSGAWHVTVCLPNTRPSDWASNHM